MASGTALAQGVLILVSPILTRLFLPEEMGLYSSYLAILLMVLVIGSWQYEQAIPIAAEPVAAAALFWLCFALLLLTSGAVFLICLAFPSPIARLLREPALAPYLGYVPLGLLAAGMYQIVNAWAIRKRSYQPMAMTRLSKSLVQAGGQVVMGGCGLGVVGLLSGDILGRLAGTVTLGRLAWRDDHEAFRRVTVAIASEQARRYRRFPLVSTWAQLANNAGVQLPVLLLLAFFGAEVAGWFALGQRVIGLPMAFLGQAVGQVFQGEAASLLHDDPAKIRGLFRRVQVRLLLLGGAPILIVSLLGPWLFAWIFGPAWRESGLYVQALSIMFVAQFVAAPLSQAINIVERQGFALAWSLLRLVLAVGSLSTGFLLRWSPFQTLALFSGCMALSYLLLMWLCQRALGGRPSPLERGT